MHAERLLVTGGAGFIGANFCHYWCGRRPHGRLVVLDALTYAGNRASLEALDAQPGFRFVHGDIRDEKRVDTLMAEEGIDTIVHFAAESHVDRSILGPDLFLETNIMGTHTLLKAAKKAWLDGGARAHRFHHVSTDEVYGSLAAGEPAFRETTPYRPNSPYAASKAASDHLVRAYAHTYGLQVTISNCSNNYGPYQFPEKLVPLIIINCLLGEPLPVYGDGANVRDWLLVGDHCEGIARILERGRPGETYNIGGNSEITNLELVTMICDVIDTAFRNDPDLAARFPDCPAASGGGCAGAIRFVKDRPGHDFRYAIDASRIRTELGFEPGGDLAAGMAGAVRWYLDHEPWWRNVMDGGYRDWMARQYDYAREGA